MKHSLLGYSLITLISLTFVPAIQADDLDKLIKQCGMCHGQDGNSPNSTIPSASEVLVLVDREDLREPLFRFMSVITIQII